MKGRRTITMVGTSLDAQGGVAAVATALIAGGLSKFYDIDYVDAHVDGSAGRKLLAAVRACGGLLSRLVAGRVSLLHVHVASRASFWRKSLLLLPVHLTGRPYILHLHGAEFRVFFEHESSWLTRQVVRYVFESAAGVVVLSESWKKWAQGSFPLARVRVIYNPAPNVSAMGKERDANSLVFLGRLGARKGVNDLIDAMVRVTQELDQARLLLGGDGDLDAIEFRARSVGVESAVATLGWVAGANKQSLLETSTVFVLPSYNEGLPMSLLEAMGNGMPVVTTPVGGIPEAVTDGLEGFLVEPGDTGALADRLIRLLRDADLREAMGAAGARKVAEVFAMDRIVPQWVDLYSEIGVLPTPFEEGRDS